MISNFDKVADFKAWYWSEILISIPENYIPLELPKGQMLEFPDDPAREWNWMPTGKSITDLLFYDSLRFFWSLIKKRRSRRWMLVFQGNGNMFGRWTEMILQS